MKVLNLLCAQDHRFEGWFASEADFQSQTERGLLVCPMCGDAGVSRLPSAPRLNVSRQRDPAAMVETGAAETPTQRHQHRHQHQPPEQHPQQAMMQSHMMRAVRHLMANTEDVGERFPEEARRIHYGESEERAIRGQATMAEAKALVEEGIAVVPLPVPAVLKGTLQ